MPHLSAASFCPPSLESSLAFYGLCWLPPHLLGGDDPLYIPTADSIIAVSFAYFCLPQETLCCESTMDADLRISPLLHQDSPATSDPQETRCNGEEWSAVLEE